MFKIVYFLLLNCVFSLFFSVISPLWTQLMVPCNFSSHLFILYRTLLSDQPNLSFRFKQINSQNCFYNIQRINFYSRHVIHFSLCTSDQIKQIIQFQPMAMFLSVFSFAATINMLNLLKLNDMKNSISSFSSK